jgi:DNA adenine methylase
LLRWAGGKRWAAEAIRVVGNHIGADSYIEPFVGGAAIFLHTHWPSAILNDANRSLIACYRGLASNPNLVRSKLARLRVDPETYLRVRRWRPTSDTGAAARLLYLNRTAFGGIYRENRKGEYNVPFAGDRGLKTVLNGTRLEEVGTALAEAELRSGDFEVVMNSARQGSLIYCDPPYSLPGTELGFRRYNSSPFAWHDQVRLAAASRDLMARGCTVIVSNSDHELVRELYRDAAVVTGSRTSTLGRGPSREHKEAMYVFRAEPGGGTEIAALLAQGLK